jgi:hypothetical protein
MSPIDLFFTHARSAWLIMMGPSDFRAGYIFSAPVEVLY